MTLCAGTARAQDERRISSPNGALEFRLFITPPHPGDLPQIAYQIRHHGRIAVDTSFLGLNVYNQEPMLGENDGLTSSRTGESRGRYRSLVAEYMQNGSIGRLINVEVRVWDDAVAFRYVVPRSTALEDLLIADELTEFAVPGNAQPSSLTLPAVVPESGGGWIGISEVIRPGLPRMSLVKPEDGALMAHLAASPANPLLAFEGKSPLVCAWRLLVFAEDRERALLFTPPSDLTQN